MCGNSKSSSSNASTQTTETTSGTATGNIASSIYQGENVTVNFPQEAVEVFKSLTDLVGNSVDVAAGAGQAALDATNKLATSTKQPDVAIFQGAQKNTMYAIVAAGVVATAFFLKK